MKNTIKVLMFGDVVGLTGRCMFAKHLQSLKSKYQADFVIVNGENSCNNGRGITGKLVSFFKEHGADIITSGNHIWDQNEVQAYLQTHTDLLRPANFPAACPGSGVALVNCNGVMIGVMNLQGRVFMREHTDDPFKVADTILTYLKSRTNVILLDFHAEATAEKLAMAFHLDGKVSAVVGTHTHVPTADERILPGGTAYVTDLGMAGSLNSMIGMTKESVMPIFLTQMPSRFVVDTKPPVVMSGVLIEINVQTGKALKIERIQVVDQDIMVTE
ncbi:MAG: TIGR00282 family metallophosphoesterase [Candidatus Chromulinivorax sp.]